MSTFKRAFAAARKAGKKEFSFGGKRFHTRLKGESAAPKSASKPAPKRMTSAPRGGHPANKKTGPKFTNAGDKSFGAFKSRVTQAAANKVAPASKNVVSKAAPSRAPQPTNKGFSGPAAKNSYVRSIQQKAANKRIARAGKER